MKRKDFDIEKFKEEKIAIHCRTEEEVNDLFDFVGWDINWRKSMGTSDNYDDNLINENVNFRVQKIFQPKDYQGSFSLLLYKSEQVLI